MTSRPSHGRNKVFGTHFTRPSIRLVAAAVGGSVVGTAAGLMYRFLHSTPITQLEGLFSAYLWKLRLER